MTQSATISILRCAVLFSALLLSGCATFRPRPLPTQPDLTRTLALTVPVSRLDLPGLKPHPFDPADGLDETTVVALAVLNDPNLKAARLKAGVAEAQLLEAGLLPDPRIDAGVARSTLHTGFNIGLSEEFQALLTRDASMAAAQAHEQQVNLEILWQEWQVAEKARILFIELRANHERQRVLATTRDLLAQHYREDEAALEGHYLAAGVVSANLKALARANANLRQLRLDANQKRHALNQLLGLEPDVRVHLAGQSGSHRLSRDQYQAAVAALPHRRADLLALQAGYRSQEQRVREAILAQFPSLRVGVERARSAEEGIYTSGIPIEVTLPLFNRNRGQIAIRRATRAVLYQTYQARLDQAVNEADQIWQATQIISWQLRALEARLPPLEKNVAAAEQSFREGDLEAGVYLSLKLNLLSQQAEAIRLRASREEAQAALQLVLGLPLNTRPSGTKGNG